MSNKDDKNKKALDFLNSDTTVIDDTDMIKFEEDWINEGLPKKKKPKE